MPAILAAALALACQSASVAAADAADKARSARGFGSAEYEWGTIIPERAEAMRLTADPVRGKEAFRGCRGCHRRDGAGVRDGTYPRLTGQHASVIIKQVTEVRSGVRNNPKMDPFASDHAVSVQEVVDIAAYLETLESVRENGKGSEDRSARGRELYVGNKCGKCHGDYGEGNAAEVFPVVAAQHYGYLLREMVYIQGGTRGNSHPDMVKAIEKFTMDDLEAVADYLSRLPDYRTVAELKSKRK
ncbi:MAG: c-type cytochrome [Gammaproteobacteria bacterium]|nr:c-type cytochrome [Gammaproteobacteria bacterium]MBU1414655.1 c-type cytochrome [Gammaproteobacteria bacterium]